MYNTINFNRKFGPKPTGPFEPLKTGREEYEERQRQGGRTSIVDTVTAPILSLDWIGSDDTKFLFHYFFTVYIT